MEFKLNFNAKNHSDCEVVVFAGFSKTEKSGKKSETKLVNSHWPKEVSAAFTSFKASRNFNGSNGDTLVFPLDSGHIGVAFGLGDKSKLTLECSRKAIAKLFKELVDHHEEVAVNLDSFIVKGNLEDSLTAMIESFLMTEYRYDTFKSSPNKNKSKLKTVILDSKQPKAKLKKAQAALDAATSVAESINLARDYVNCPPNDLNSITFAKRVVADAKKLKGVKSKVLGRAELKKEKMGMFLAVNQGSDYEAQLVHLTYTPAKATKNTKHIVLVGKGLTFDTGTFIKAWRFHG